MGCHILEMLRFRVHLYAPDLLPELVDMLERAECVVRRLGPAEIAVDVPRAPSSDQAERELRIYLAVWDAQHPDAQTALSPAGG
jgi:hypothetical protein